MTNGVSVMPSPFSFFSLFDHQSGTFPCAEEPGEGRVTGLALLIRDLYQAIFSREVLSVPSHTPGPARRGLFLSFLRSDRPESSVRQAGGLRTASFFRPADGSPSFFFRKRWRGISLPFLILLFFFPSVASWVQAPAVWKPLFFF